MTIIAECKVDIISHGGNVLFKRGLEYKGSLHEGKGKAYIIKDETGCWQSISDEKFFKTHFKVIQDGME